jgi:hypothetical protein
VRTWQATTAKETASQVIGWLPGVVECPTDEVELKERLTALENYLLKDDGNVLGWMALDKGEFWRVRGFVIRKECRKCWFSRSVAKSFSQNVFKKDRSFVLFDTDVPEVLKMALRLGAKPFYDSRVIGKYALTAENFKRSFNA